jgi:hypothetical protein
MITFHDPARSHRKLFIKIMLIDIRVLKHPLIKLRVVLFNARLLLLLLLLDSLETYVFNYFLHREISLFLETIKFKLFFCQSG